MEVKFDFILDDIDDLTKEWVTKYWFYDHEKKRFPNLIQDLRKEYNITNLAKLTETYSRAYVVEMQFCKNCNAKILLTSRSPVQTLIKTCAFYCRNCRKRNVWQFNQSTYDFSGAFHPPKEKKEYSRIPNGAEQSNWPEQPSSDFRLEELKNAARFDAVMTINGLCKNFFIEYCRWVDFKKAAIHVGISEQISLGLIEELQLKNLLCSMTGYVLPETRELMLEQARSVKTKSVWGLGNKLFEIKRFLKLHYIHVELRQYLIEFCNDEHAYRLFERHWHKEYYLHHAAVDLLVVNEEGHAIFGIDYLSTGFENTLKREKLLFVKKTLNGLGIGHYCIDAKDLYRMKWQGRNFDFPGGLSEKLLEN